MTIRATGSNRAALPRWSWLPALAVALSACGGGSDKADERVAKLELVQHSALLTAAGQERQLAVRALNASGGQIDSNVVWTSSTPDQVSVDATGKVRSVTSIGSAQVFAEAGGLRSTPVLISTVELKPGTLLLSDADIVQVAPPVAPAPGMFPGPGTQYDIWLAGQQAPALGTVVLAAGAANVSGKVVGTAVEANRVRVRLQRLAMPDLLARYDVNWSIDLAPFDIVIDGQASGQREQPAAVAGHPRAAAAASTLPEWKVPKEGVKSPCSASVEAKFKAKPLQIKVTGAPKIEAFSSKLDDTLPPGRLRIALVGDFYIETSVGLTAEAGITAEAKCELKAHIPLTFLPPPFGLILQVPVGIGVAAGGTIEIVSIDIGLSGKNGAKFEMGIDCTAPQPCIGLDKAERINEFTPHMEISSAETEGLKVELEAGAYFLTGIDVVIGIAQASYEFNMLEVKAGPKQKADFGTMKRQIDVVPYKSDYDFAFVLEVGPGGAIKDLIKELLGGEPAELSFGLKVSLPISESPRGTWKADKTTAIPNRDIVKFDIDLTPFSTTYWKLGYNVEKIEVYHRREGAREFTLIGALSAIEPQAHFETTWNPTPADAGRNDFVVFAVSKLPVVRLEVDTMKSVQVGCIAASGSGRGSERALAVSGVCKEEWVGSASGEIFGAVTFDAPPPFLWEQDLTLQLGPNISALRPAKTGSFVTVQLTVYKNLGCTVSPERFDGSNVSQASLMTVDRNFDPPKFSFGLQIDAELTITCPHSEPFKLPTRVLAIDGAGEITEKGTRMQGGTNTAQGRYSYSFALKVPDTAAVASARGGAREGAGLRLAGYQ